VRPAGGNPLYIAALGAASSGEHSPAQVEEILRNQERAAQDPQASQLEAGRTVWIGGSNHADGTYGGGRYLLDTVKGADLGRATDGGLVLDLNFAYNPSCAYDPAWACPLATRGNVLDAEVPVGERQPDPMLVIDGLDEDEPVAEA